MVFDDEEGHAVARGLELLAIDGALLQVARSLYHQRGNSGLREFDRRIVFEPGNQVRLHAWPVERVELRRHVGHHFSAFEAFQDFFRARGDFGRQVLSAKLFADQIGCGPAARRQQHEAGDGMTGGGERCDERALAVTDCDHAADARFAFEKFEPAHRILDEGFGAELRFLRRRRCAFAGAALVDPERRDAARGKFLCEELQAVVLAAREIAVAVRRSGARKDQHRIGGSFPAGHRQRAEEAAVEVHLPLAPACRIRGNRGQGEQKECERDAYHGLSFSHPG